MSFLPKTLLLIGLMPLWVSAAEPLVPPVVSSAQAIGLTFSKPIELSCEFKSTQSEALTPELKSFLVREGFQFTLSTIMNGNRQVIAFKAVAKRSGLMDADSVSALVRQVEALAKGQPIGLLWSVTQRMEPS